MATEHDPLSRVLAAALRKHPDGALCVAFSGGADSAALLDALTRSVQARQRGLRAVHVDHGLHPHSPRWAEQARAFCAAREVPLIVLPVTVRPCGEGPEAAARRARLSAFAAMLDTGEQLLLAHHRDDQVETVLLKLLRGAGPEGLGGMRARRPLGRGTLWRPLLELPRAVLRRYADAHALAVVEDPSNADPHYARNRLRLEILPRLRESWPQADRSITHAARLCRDADTALRAQWQGAYPALVSADGTSLDAAGWLALPAAVRHPLLDHWLHRHGLPAPSSTQREELERQQRSAQIDRVPCLSWGMARLSLWQGRWWLRRARAPVAPDWQCTWHGEPLALPLGGELTLVATAGQTPRLARPLRITLRRGGERLRPAGDAHTRELRDLFQAAAMPPWQRAACPLIHEDEHLIAVADRWLSARAVALLDAIGARLRWTPPHD